MHGPDSDTVLTIPGSWRETARRIQDSPGLVMILGESDTGKSTLCVFLAKHLCSTGARVGLVDSDVGQSTLGPPMTIGGKICFTPADVRADLHPRFLYFTGSTTPVGRMVESIEGTARVAQRVRAEGATWIVVDTTGMIEGETGRQLKLQKARLLRPAWIIALQRGDEVEGIVGRLESEGRRILRCEVPSEVKRRSREQRRRRRFDAYAEYFRNARRIQVEIGSVWVYDKDSEAPSGTLAGLNDRYGDTLAVGVTTAFDRERGTVRLKAPPHEVRDVTYLKLADLTSDRMTSDLDG